MQPVGSGIWVGREVFTASHEGARLLNLRGGAVAAVVAAREACASMRVRGHTAPANDTKGPFDGDASRRSTPCLSVLLQAGVQMPSL